ncbi:ORF6C domain-containing protein [Streptococcus ferus]|uniref:ORF6C domain-containing protein n=1 Tax=Streptococcus ferus TaxID=1345 RepID=UPI003512596E
MTELVSTEKLIAMSENMTATLKKVSHIEKQLAQHTNDIQEIKDTSYLHPAIINMMTKNRRKRVIECMGGKDSKAYRHVEIDSNGVKHRLSSVVFREMEVDFKSEFDLHSYAELPRSKRDEANQYIQEWEPCTNTKRRIKQINSQSNLQEGA